MQEQDLNQQDIPSQSSSGSLQPSQTENMQPKADVSQSDYVSGSGVTTAQQEATPQPDYVYGSGATPQQEAIPQQEVTIQHDYVSQPNFAAGANTNAAQQQTTNQYNYTSQPNYSYPQSPGQMGGSSYEAPIAVNPKGTGALVCGIASIVFSGFAVPSLILGIIAIVLAVKAVKGAPSNTKIKAGKICGIIGTVLSILSLLFWIILGGLIVDSISSLEPTTSSSSSSIIEPEETTPLLADEEAALEEAATLQYDKIINMDAELVNQLAQNMDLGLQEATGSSLTDLGVDPVMFTEWTLGDFDYQLNGVYDNGDGTGIVFATVTLRDSMSFAFTFMEDAQAAIDAGEMNGLTEEQAAARLGEIYIAAMEKTTGTMELESSLDFVKEGDVWVVDETSWNSEIEYLFELY